MKETCFDYDILSCGEHQNSMMLLINFNERFIADFDKNFRSFISNLRLADNDDMSTTEADFCESIHSTTFHICYICK